MVHTSVERIKNEERLNLEASLRSTTRRWVSRAKMRRKTMDKKPLMITRRIETTFMILSFIIISFALIGKSHAGLFGGYVPEGNEIKDNFLEQLFAPEYPYEWVKVIDTKGGKRYVVIKAKQTINKEMEKDYQEKTLRGRNIAIYRYHSPRNNELVTTNIRLSRKVSDKPYVIEYCQASPWASRDKEKDIAWRTGKNFVLWIDHEFGKRFKKLTIYPDKELTCPEPPFVGRYPNSATLGCTRQTFIKPSQPYYEKGQSRIIFTYVSKDAPEKIYDFYREKLLKHFEQTGIDYPERFWKINYEYGIQISHEGIDIVDTILRSMEDKYIFHGLLESNSLKEKPPARGIVFNIKIFKGVFAENLIKEYSWIEIYYDFDPNVIEKKMKGTTLEFSP